MSNEKREITMEGFAKIEFIENATIEICESYNEETDEAEFYSETFKKGEIEEVDILNDEEKTVDFQFGDGSVALGIPKEIFKIIEIV